MKLIMYPNPLTVRDNKFIYTCYIHPKPLRHCFKFKQHLSHFGCNVDFDNRIEKVGSNVCVKMMLRLDVFLFSQLISA